MRQCLAWWIIYRREFLRLFREREKNPMPDNSFDAVSQIEMPEVSNAIQQAMKEVTTRYDLKDSKSSMELNEKDKKLTLSSADDYKLKAITEILQSKLIKRAVPVKNLTYGVVTPAAGSTVKQEVTLTS